MCRRSCKPRGELVVAIDNLSTGFRQAVLAAPPIVGDIGDRELVAAVLREHRIVTVMHFAASAMVPESVRDPLKYYGNNTCAKRNLIDGCMRAGVRQLVLSSSAAVYGNPAGGICDEELAPTPVNPYGTSKLMSEWMLRDQAASGDFLYVSVCYFNVAGPDQQRRIGQSTRAAMLLIKVACEAIVGERPHLSIFGTDDDTPMCATRSTSRTWRARTSMRSISCVAAAPQRCSTVAIAAATAYVR